MSNRNFVVFAFVVFALGITAGCRLSALPRVETYKLLNIAGLFYDFVAVMVLSEMATSSTKWKAVSVNLIAPAVLWIHTLLPLGAVAGGLLASALLRGPSAVTISSFAFAFLAYSIIPLGVLEATVAFPRLPVLRTLESRRRWFGLFLLLSGVGLQFLAAILGFKAV